MFESFFPRPKLFFPSVIIWAVMVVSFWYNYGVDVGLFLGFNLDPERAPIVGPAFFITAEFMWFYLYYAVICGLFAGFWFLVAPHRWQVWSIIVSQVILLSTYSSVQVSVAINNWRLPFGNTLQNGLNPEIDVTPAEMFNLLLIFAQIALVWMVIYVITRFIVSHYIFRWRTAMNDFYMSKWRQVRHIEGASQRIQEDTMRFAGIMEGLGVSIIDAIMTLFAFLPVLYVLSQHVETLPIIGVIPYPLFTVAIFWAIFGTGLLASVGIKLPGLEFRNQRVEAAYRKELVYGEDDEARAQPITVRELFSNLRKNYFRLYFHYMYFNVFRGLYIQADNIFAYFILVPTIVSGRITYGVLQQILTAFTQVTSSFQYLVNSWTTIVELLSIFKRLHAFEAAIHDQPLPSIDQEYLEKGSDLDQ